MLADVFDKLLSDFLNRIEHTSAGLKHHCDVLAADLSPFLRGIFQEIFPIEHDFAVSNMTFVRQTAKNRTDDCSLSAS